MKFLLSVFALILFSSSMQGQIASSKWVIGHGYNGDGEYIIKYQVRIKNNSPNEVCSVQIIDDLNNSGLSGVSVSGLLSWSWPSTGNYSWDGIGNNNLLSGSDCLNPGDETNTVFVAKFSGGNSDEYIGWNYDNQVQVVATNTSTSQVYNDFSEHMIWDVPQSGSGTANQTPNMGIEPISENVIGAALALQNGPELLADGTFDFTYRITICNYGDNDPISPSGTTEDLEMLHFDMPFMYDFGMGKVNSSTVSEVSVPATSNIIINPTFTGDNTDWISSDNSPADGMLGFGDCAVLDIDINLGILEPWMLGWDLWTSFEAIYYGDINPDPNVDSWNWIQETSTDGLDPDPNEAECNGPVDNCQSTPIQFSYPDVSGTLFYDEDGVFDNAVDGTGTGEPDDTQIYVTLVDPDGTVYASVPLNPDGTYSISNVAPSLSDYTMMISTNEGTVGSSTPPIIELPGEWGFTGEGLQSDGENAGDGTPNGTQNFNVAVGGQVQVDFGIEVMPIADNYFEVISAPEEGEIMALTAANSLPELTGMDFEDGSQGSGDSLIITSLPTNGTLYYNGVEITGITSIGNYDPALLEIEFSGTGYTSIKFEYAWVDDAGIMGESAEYELMWSIIPIELISFDVELKGHNSHLTWKTASEVNNEKFVIQYSNDGRYFSDLAEVKGSGNSSTIKEYSYTHKAIHSLQWNTIYYRLKQIDFDGKFDFSKVELLAIENSSSVEISPNPVEENGILNIYNDQINEIKLYNVNGKLLTTMKFSEESSSQSIDLNNFQSGFYFIQINQTFTEKIVIP